MMMIKNQFNYFFAIIALAVLIGLMLQCSHTSTTIENRSVTLSISDTLVRAGMETSLSIISSHGSNELMFVLAQIDHASHRDTIAGNNSLNISWEAADTGIHQIHLTGYWADGYQQVLDSIRVRVTKCDGTLALPADMHIAWFDTLKVSAQISNNCANIQSYCFRMRHNNSETIDSQLISTFSHTFSARDTGRWELTAVGYDARGYAAALPDTMIITVQSDFPVISLVADSLIFAGNSLTISAKIVSFGKEHLEFIWSYDGGNSWHDTTTSGKLTFATTPADSGRREILAFARDAAHNIVTNIDTLHIRIVPCLPVISLRMDSLVSAGTTIACSVNVLSSCAENLCYIWSRAENFTWTDTTISQHLTIVTSSADSGLRTIAVFAQGTQSRYASPQRTATYVITPNRPVISLGSDTFIDINKTLRIPVSILHADFSLLRYIWIISGRPDTIQTTHPFLDITFSPSEAGPHALYAYAIDTRGIASSTVSRALTIHSYPPHIQVPHDTMVSYRDALNFSVSAHDSNGAIIRYLWSTSNLGWQDSSTDSTYRLMYYGSSQVVMYAGARDADGQLAIDSFVVRFNTAPKITSALFPHDSILTRQATGSFTSNPVQFSFAATDADNDSLRYFLRMGTNAAILPIINSNQTGLFTLPHVDTGYYYWQVTIADTFGNTATRSGEFSVLLQKTICFAGHSIMAGMLGGGSNYHRGGARLTILDTLRAHASRYERWQPVGPLLTGYIDAKSDDSCLSLSGSSAGNTNAMLNQSTPDLQPDIWTLLTGVNSGFTTAELNATLGCLQSMHDKNPFSAIYVCGGLPLPDGYYKLYYEPIFNQTLQDTAESKRLQGWNIKYVDIYSAFLDTAGMPRGDLMPDNLHPNAAGYDTLAYTILRAMGY